MKLVQSTSLTDEKSAALVCELKDRVDLAETMHAYCRCADNLDVDGMLDLFVDNCVASYHPTDPKAVLHGKAQLRLMLSGALKEVVSGSHHITNIEIIFDGSSVATLLCYMYSWQRFQGYPAPRDCHRWGRYENQLVRMAAGWRLAHLRLLSAGELGGDRIGEQLGRPFPPNFQNGS